MSTSCRLIGDLSATRASEAIAAGIYGLEHASVAYQDLVPVERQVGFDYFHTHACGSLATRVESWHGRSGCHGTGSGQALARQFADNGVFLDPTLVVMECMSCMNDPRVTEAPGVAHMPESIRAGWEARAAGSARQLAAAGLLGCAQRLRHGPGIRGRSPPSRRTATSRIRCSESFRGARRVAAPRAGAADRRLASRRRKRWWALRVVMPRRWASATTWARSSRASWRTW